MNKIRNKAMNEALWTKRICMELERVCLQENIPLVVTPLTASRHSQHGIPDRHFTSKIWRGLVEFKGISTEVTRTQQRFAKQQNLVVPYSCFVWRKVNNTLLVKLEYYDVGMESASIGSGDCLSMLRAMGDFYKGGLHGAGCSV